MLVLKKCFEKQLIMPLFDENPSLLDNDILAYRLID